MASVFSPVDSALKIRVRSGTDSGGKPIIKTISLSKILVAATADACAAVSAAIAPLIDYPVTATERTVLSSVEAA